MGFVAGHLRILVKNLEIAIIRLWSQHFSIRGPLGALNSQTDWI